MHSNKNSPLNSNMTLNLPILPLTMELLSLRLGLEHLKDRTIKSSTMSLALCSTIIPEFCKYLK
jgi:hypothetical protein